MNKTVRISLLALFLASFATLARADFYKPPTPSTRTNTATMGIASTFHIFKGTNPAGWNSPVVTLSTAGISTIYGVRSTTLTVTSTATFQGLMNGTTGQFYTLSASSVTGTFYGNGGNLTGISSDGSTAQQVNSTRAAVMDQIASTRTAIYADLQSTAAATTAGFLAVAGSTQSVWSAINATAAALSSYQQNLSVTTGTLASSVTTLSGQMTAVAGSTAALYAAISSTATDVNALRNAVAITTANNYADLQATAAATTAGFLAVAGSTSSAFTAIGSTWTNLNSRVQAVAGSTGTGILYSDVFQSSVTQINLGTNLTGSISGSKLTISASGGGGSSLPLPGGSTGYAQNTSSLQAGATIYIGTGTIQNLNASSITISANGASPTQLPDTPLQVIGNTSGYLQVMVKNLNRGTSSSALIGVMNDLGSQTSGYAVLEINNSTNTDAKFTIAAGSDTILTASNRSIAIVTQDGDPTSAIKFGTGGGMAANERMRIGSAGGISIGTTTTDIPLRVSRPNATSGVQVQVTTGTTVLFEVTGASVNVGANQLFVAGTGGTASPSVAIRNSNTGFYADATSMYWSIAGTNGGAFKSSGLALLSGSAATPSLITTSGNAGIYWPTSSSMAIGTNATFRMAFAQAGQIGIGEATPIACLQVTSGTTGSAVPLLMVSTASNPSPTQKQFEVTRDSATFWGKTFLGSLSTMTFSHPMNPGIMGARLSLSATEAISVSSLSLQGTIYLVPMPQKGNMVCGRDSSSNTICGVLSSTISVALTGTAGTNKDIWLQYLNGAFSLSLSSAWQSDTVRSDSITWSNGYWVSSATSTKILAGTVRFSADNLVDDSPSKRFVSNAFNRVQKTVFVPEQSLTSSWTYNTGSWRAANGNTGNSFQSVYCLPQIEATSLRLGVMLSPDPSTNGIIGIGIDQSAPSMPDSWYQIAVGGAAITGEILANVAEVGFSGAAGFHRFYWLEYADGGTITFYGYGSNKRISSLAGTGWW